MLQERITMQQHLSQKNEMHYLLPAKNILVIILNCVWCFMKQTKTKAKQFFYYNLETFNNINGKFSGKNSENLFLALNGQFTYSIE